MKGLVCLILAAALAGCTAPEEEAPDLLGACPQWIAGPEKAPLQQDGHEVLVEANETHDGFPLDMYLLNLSSEAPVEVRAFPGEASTRLEFHVQRAEEVQTVPFLHLDGAREVQVFLTPVAHGTEPAPSPLRLTFNGTAGVEVVATPFYRVCGVLLDA